MSLKAGKPIDLNICSWQLSDRLGALSLFILCTSALGRSLLQEEAHKWSGGTVQSHLHLILESNKATC